MRPLVFMMVALVPACAQTSGVSGVGGGLGAGIGSAITFTGAGMDVSSRGNNNEVTFTYNIPKGAVVFSVPGAPYSGHASRQTLRTLANGTHLTQQAFQQPMTCRDSMGRTRTESRMQPAPPNSNIQPQIADLPEITDPVAGYRYILDPVHQVAHRVSVQVRQNPGPGPAGPAMAARMAAQPPRTRDDGATVQAENLGTQTMFGVPVAGLRTTTTYPAGTYQGNDQPVTIVNEGWSSVQYRMLMRSSNTGPDGDTTMVMKDFSTDEPDPSLFMVPTGYQVVDETGEFTVTIPRNSQ